MTELSIHPQHAAQMLETALSDVWASSPDQVGNQDLLDAVLVRNPSCETAKSQLLRMAGDLLKAKYGFGELMDEAERIKAQHPSTLTQEQRQYNAKRLEEIGAIFMAQADALEEIQ